MLSNASRRVGTSAIAWWRSGRMAWAAEESSYRNWWPAVNLLHSSTFLGQQEEDRNQYLYRQALPFISARSFATQTTDKEKEEASSLRDRMRDRASDLREKTQQRASVLRDNAQQRYQDFREDPRESARQSAKTLSGALRQYGPVFVGTYMSVYFFTLATLFAGIQTGLLDPVSLFGFLGHGAEGTDGETANTVNLVIDFMNSYTLTEPYAHVVEKYPSVANLAVAWIAVKFTEPPRLALSLAITPRIARYLGFATKVDKQQATQDRKDQTEN